MTGGAIVNPGGLEWARWLAETHAARSGGYALAGRYYDGDHRAKVPEKVRHWLEQNYSFRGNLCDVVVDALAERLVVTGFVVDGPDGQQAGEAAWRWWRKSKLDATSRVLHKEAAKLGDMYLLVDWERAGRPRFTYQTPDQLFPRYANRELVYAVKVWDLDATTRRYNVYFPDRVERYVATKSARRGLLTTPDTWSVPSPVPDAGLVAWAAPDGSPLGVPVVHFRNNAQSGDYGRPEHAQVIPLQDMLNKSLVDLALVMDTMGFPQRWATGPTPQGHEWSVAPGRVWKADDPEAKFGQFDAADPRGLIDTIMLLVNIAAGRSRTPQHLFHIAGDYPTGEALKTAEAGFINKVEDRTVTFGNAWEQALQLAFLLDNAFGRGRWSPDLLMDTLWRPFELRNEQAHAQAEATLSGMLPRRESWRRLGYTPQQIERLEAEWAEQQQQDGERSQTAFQAAFRGD